MQDSSAFQFLALDTIHESTTNPRQTFDQGKLYELAESIRQHGLIQPITVRPNANGFEIVAGARRFRAAQLAELFAMPARIVEVTDAQAMEWQLVENSQRVDVHPYEEAQGFQRLLDLPGYDVSALVEKSGKSASHIYARLSLLQLILSVAEAFTQERITASHASLIARLPQEHQHAAFEQCWRKDWQDSEPHLLPAKHVAAWIQANLYLSLADAPFDCEDPTLNPAAGACTTCPRRSGYNRSLFCDVQGDQCLDAPCFHAKVEAHIDRELAARPGLVQIELAWRPASQQRPGTLDRNAWRELDITDNPDAEPPCEATRTGIVVFGKQTGTTRAVCIDRQCPVHNPAVAARLAQQQAATEAERNAEPEPDLSVEERAVEEKHRKEQEAEQKRKAEERRQEFERQQQEYEAEQERRTAIQKERIAIYDRLIAKAPANFTAPQWRALLRALVNLDPYTLADDVAAELAEDEDADERSPEEVLMETITALSDAQLPGFAIRIALSGHTGIPREGETDFLAEAEAAFNHSKRATPNTAKTNRKSSKPVKQNQKAPGKKKVAA